MQNVLKYSADKIIKPYVVRRLQKTSVYKWKNISVVVQPGVFHPGYFFSTKFLLRYIKTMKLQNKKFLELGAGSGLISMYAATQNAVVTASDVNTTAVESMYASATLNRISLKILTSNIFDDFPQQIFDIIIINPPYFSKDPVNDKEKAWYCGAHFQYFEKLFKQLPHYINLQTEVIMILSSACEREKIIAIAQKNNFYFDEIKRKRFLWEKQFIYKINRGNV